MRFEGAVGAGYACAVNSCTAALHLSLEAMGIGPGDRVLVPAMTFTGSAEIVRYLGGDPVLLDLDYGTRMFTPEILDRALSEDKAIKAVVVVHFGGQAAPLLDGNGREGDSLGVPASWGAADRGCGTCFSCVLSREAAFARSRRSGQ